MSLQKMQVTDYKGCQLNQEEGLFRWCEITRKVKESNATMYMVGNGASAAMASHMAVDASKNAGFRSMAFNDAAFMTAVSNDISYKECFAVPLRRFANPGDVLVTISSSGNSPNVIRAIETSREIDLKVITLSGMQPDNSSRKKGDLNFYIPASTYGIVEASHQVLLHCWLDLFVDSQNDVTE